MPFLLAAQLTSPWTLTALVSIGGFLLQSTHVTFGQQIAPVSAALVSSLMMGFAWGVGSLLAPAVGIIGDRFGLNVALTLTALAPLVAAALAVPLPRAVHVEMPPSPASFDGR